MKPGRTISAFAGSALLTKAASTTIPRQNSAPEPFTDFVNNVVYIPGEDYYSWKTIYGRTLQLKDGSHIVTWENYAPEPPLEAFPIFKSEDGGATWTNFSRVDDQVNGWGTRY